MHRLIVSILAAVFLAAANAPVAAAQEQRAGASAKKAITGIVNINTASAADLERLPGIGAKVAARIIEYRQKNGPFKKIEEILEISRSCPYSLNVFDFGVHRSVSGSRQKSQ